MCYISGQDAFQARDLIPRTPSKPQDGKGLLINIFWKEVMVNVNNIACNLQERAPLWYAVSLEKWQLKRLKTW